MLKLWRFTVFFLLCLVVFLLFNLPIQQLLPYVKLPPSIRLAGIDGTILKGKAAEIVVNEFPIRALRYRYMPSCIPLLKVCYRIDYEQGKLQLAYDILNGDTEVTRTRLEYPVAELLTQFPDRVPVTPSGRLQLEIDEMSMLEDRLVAVNGRLIWRDLGLNDDGIKIDIGDYQVDFTGNPAQYDFKFSDLDADLGVSGDGSIDAQGNYAVDVRISAENGIEPHVRSVLNLVAARSSVNSYRIEQKGRLPKKTTRQLFR